MRGGEGVSRRRKISTDSLDWEGLKDESPAGFLFLCSLMSPSKGRFRRMQLTGEWQEAGWGGD